MTRFVSDHEERCIAEALCAAAVGGDDAEWAMAESAIAEAEFILSANQPYGAVVVRLDFPFHSMLSPGELSDSRVALADTLWGFVNG